MGQYSLFPEHQKDVAQCANHAHIITIWADRGNEEMDAIACFGGVRDGVSHVGLVAPSGSDATPVCFGQAA
jgi:hypothetical protein